MQHIFICLAAYTVATFIALQFVYYTDILIIEGFDSLDICLDYELLSLNEYSALLTFIKTGVIFLLIILVFNDLLDGYRLKNLYQKN